MNDCILSFPMPYDLYKENRQEWHNLQSWKLDAFFCTKIMWRTWHILSFVSRQAGNYDRFMKKRVPWLLSVGTQWVVTSIWLGSVANEQQQQKCWYITMKGYCKNLRFAFIITLFFIRFQEGYYPQLIILLNYGNFDSTF